MHRVCVLFAPQVLGQCRKTLAHCLCPRTKKYHSTPSPSTHLGSTRLGRQVIRARCLQRRRMTASSNVYFGCNTTTIAVCSSSFCLAIAEEACERASAGWDFQLYDRLRFCAHPDSSALALAIVQVVDLRILGNTKDCRRGS